VTFREFLDLTQGDEVEVWFGGQWVPAHVHRRWGVGADCIVGSHGCWYFKFEQMRRA
jgi:hypothetical protein